MNVTCRSFASLAAHALCVVLQALHGVVPGVKLNLRAVVPMLQ